jgi:hypothetical protein
LEAATGFPPMSVKYLVGLENFLFFHEKYRVFVSRFRFAYIFLTKFILQRNELPYMPKGGDKRCLKILFLDQLPLGLGKRILENESLQEMMKVGDLETLMNHVDTIVDKFRKQHMLFRASQRTLLGDTEYDTRYGKYDTVLKKMPDMRYTPKADGKLSELGEVTEASNVGDVLANLQTQHEQLKAAFETYISENEKFTGKGVKAAAARARKALQEMSKAIKERRKEITAEKEALAAPK